MTAPAVFKFSVPLLPPSVNHYKKPRHGGGFYRTGEVISFVDAVCVCSQKHIVAGVFYEVDVTFYLPAEKFERFSSSDSDNFLKVAIDALEAAQVITSDGRILDLHVHKRQAPSARDARTEYEISGWVRPTRTERLR